MILERCITELIDTLWNVNETAVWTVETAVLELIDTLWNVNRKAKEYYIDILEN